MLARLFLALLLALFATPASAAECHDARPAAPHAMPMAGEHQRDMAAPHACVGCIPPSDWLAARVSGPALVPVARPIARERWRHATHPSNDPEAHPVAS